MRALRSWAYIGLGLLLQGICSTAALGDATFKLPEAYNVLCGADPVVRIDFLERYNKQFQPYGTPEQKEFLVTYLSELKEVMKGTEEAVKYPAKLQLRTDPSTAPILFLDAYVAKLKTRAFEPLSLWSLVDITNPLIPFMRSQYWGNSFTDRLAVRTAFIDFRTKSRYPTGYWTIEVSTPFEEFKVENERSTTWFSPADSTPGWHLGNPIRFEGRGCQDWTSKERSQEGYAIKTSEDPKLAPLKQAIARVDQLKGYVQGAILHHARGPIQEGVVFVEANEFKGLVLNQTAAQTYLRLQNTANSKEKLSRIYGVVDSKPVVEFANYDDFAKKFFYRERYEEATLRDKTQRVNLHIQPGWLAWKKEADQLDKDKDGLVVDNQGCIKGKRNDGSPFEVCGTLLQTPAHNRSTQTSSPHPPSPGRYLFFAEKKDKKILLGQALVGEKLHAHHGRILNAQGQTVAGLPLPQESPSSKRLQRALGLLLKELPGATLEALSEVFSFSGLYDLSKSILMGTARQAILHFLGVGLLNDLWLLLTELRHGYTIYSVLSEFWDEVGSAKDEYQLYDASDKLRPLVKELVANAAKKEVIKRAEKYVDEQEEQAQKEQKQQSKEITQEQKEKRVLRSAEEKQKNALKKAEKQRIYDALPPLERLMLDTNKDFRITRENAELALIGPPGTKPIVQGVGAKGADVIFKDKDGKIVLKRELKSITSIDKLGDRISLAAKQLEHLSELIKEVMIQVPAESDAETTVKRFRGTIRKEKHRQEKYKDITLIVIDDEGKIRYIGPVLYEERPEDTTRVAD